MTPAELRAIARKSPGEFAELVNKKYVLARHLELLNQHILRLVNREITRLMVLMPPRHGKSEFISKYTTAWYVGNFPDHRVILASYEAEFASTWGGKSRDILERYGPGIFGVRINQTSHAANHWELEGHSGGMQTCGIGGPLVGKGANFLVIDDPIKNAEEANSETIRNKHWDWWRSTAYTRLEPNAIIAFILTPWHQDDLRGRILAHAQETGEQWVTLRLPAFADTDDALGRVPGQALWPDRYDESKLEAIKRTLGTYWFTAQYQGRPTPPEGGLFKKHWFRYFEDHPEHFRLLGPEGRSVRKIHCRRFGTMDLAFSLKTEADFTVVCAWAVTPQHDLLLLDMLRGQMGGEALVPAAQQMASKYDLDYVGIESILAQSLVVHHARVDAGLTVRSLLADRDKISRSIPAQVRMEAGQIYLPKGHSELSTIESELLDFPRGAHDDIVDCLSYAAADVQRFGGAPKPPEIVEQERKDEMTADQNRRIESDRAAQEDFDHVRWW
jgi:predicted phage terminase large subunit-like protein